MYKNPHILLGGNVQPLGINPRVTVETARLSPGGFNYMLLVELIERYKNWGGLSYKKGTVKNCVTRGYEYDLRQLCLYLHNPNIETILEQHVTRYFTEMLELGWSPNSLMPKSVTIRNIFKYARMIGCNVIDYNLIQIIPREYKIPRVAEDWEIEKLLEVCPKTDKNNLQAMRNRCMITFLRATGCRNSEMINLNIPQLMEHFDEKCVVILTAKSKGIKPIRELFWDDEAHEDLKRWLWARGGLQERIEFKDPDAVFVGVRNWQIGKRLTNGAVAIAFRAMSKKAGLSTVNPHSFRHHRGHELNTMGANNSNISGILGHSSLASSYVYTQMNSSEMQNAAEKYRHKPQ